MIILEGVYVNGSYNIRTRDGWVWERWDGTKLGIWDDDKVVVTGKLSQSSILFSESKDWSIFTCGTYSGTMAESSPISMGWHVCGKWIVCWRSSSIP